MLNPRCFLTCLIILTGCIFAFGQEENEQPQKNWLREYNIYSEQFLYHRFDRYSKEDIKNLRAKLDLIGSTRLESDWEGPFTPGYHDEVGASLLKISFKSGFASLYVYTCLPELRQIDYGKAINNTDAIELIPDIPASSPRNSKRTTYVKVKWDKRRYLVDEASLAAFGQKAVGIYIEPEEGDEMWSNFWVGGDVEGDVMGLPEFPARFRHLQRRPIETRIINVGKRKIEKEISLGNTYYTADSATYRVVIGAGLKQGVKKGLNFGIRGTYDELVITSTNANSSTGIIVRAIDDDGRADHCLTDAAELIKCSEIKPGQMVSTIVGKFWL